MAYRQLKRFKTYWLLFNLILLALPVFLPSFPDGFWGNVIGVCYTAIILQSYPLCLLPIKLLYWLGVLNGSIGSLYFQMFICFAVGYFQWCVLVPRLIKAIRPHFANHDCQINFNVVTAKQLIETKNDIWTPANWYDEQKRTPVERMIDEDKD